MQPVLPVQATRPRRIALASMARPSASICCLAASIFSSGTPEISRFCQTVRRISPSPQLARDFGEAFHLRHGQAADRHDDADPVQSVLLLRVDADMRGAVDRRARQQRIRHRAIELAAELLLDQFEEFLDADLLQHIFQPRLGAVGAVAGIDEGAHHRVGHLGGVGGLHQHAGVAGEAAMAGQAAEAEPEPDTGASRASFVATAWKPMSLVSSSTGMMPPPSKPTLNLRGRP